MSKRSDAITHMRIAGYHGDQRAFVRLLTETRVARAAADDAYRTGQQQKAGGMACACHLCKKG